MAGSTSKEGSPCPLRYPLTPNARTSLIFRGFDHDAPAVDALREVDERLAARQRAPEPDHRDRAIRSDARDAAHVRALLANANGTTPGFALVRGGRDEDDLLVDATVLIRVEVRVPDDVDPADVGTRGRRVDGDRLLVVELGVREGREDGRSPRPASVRRPVDRNRVAGIVFVEKQTAEVRAVRGPNATHGSEARSHVPPLGRVSPGTRPSVHVTPSSVLEANPSARAPPLAYRLSCQPATRLRGFSGFAARYGSAWDSACDWPSEGRRSWLTRTGAVVRPGASALARRARTWMRTGQGRDGRRHVAKELDSPRVAREVVAAGKRLGRCSHDE